MHRFHELDRVVALKAPGDGVPLGAEGIVLDPLAHSVTVEFEREDGSWTQVECSPHMLKLVHDPWDDD
jgi:hypothetical protein